MDELFYYVRSVKMFKWPSLKFPPINLNNAPLLHEIRFNQERVYDYEADVMYHDVLASIAYSHKISHEKKLKELSFLYYCRTGKFPK